MKNTVKGIILIVAIFIIMPGICGNAETHYNRKGTVIEVQNDVIVVCDESMNVWEFEGDGFSVGETVTMKMFTNYTDNNIYDDEIVKVKRN